MSFTIERAFHVMQAASPEEHLPLEAILEALHDEEYPPPPFFRRIDVPGIGAMSLSKKAYGDFMRPRRA